MIIVLIHTSTLYKVNRYILCARCLGCYRNLCICSLKTDYNTTGIYRSRFLKQLTVLANSLNFSANQQFANTRMK